MKLTIPLPQKINSNLFDIYISLILLMPLSTLLQKQLDAINKILFVIIFFFQIIVLFLRINKKAMMFMTVSLFAYIVVLYNTEDLSMDNQIVYYVNWLIYATVISINKDKFFKFIKDNEFYIKAVMFVWSFLVGISIFLPSSYYSKEGEANYFSSFTESIFRLAPSALFIEILALICIIVYKHKKDIIYTFVPLFCGFMGSSRTYFVVILLVFIICLYYFTNSKLKFSLMAIPLGAVGAFIFTKSSLMEKILFTLDENQYGDFLFRVTSSRSVIWENIWNAYLKLPLSKQLFGSGFGFTNKITSMSNRGLGLYAHNDFIEIIATHGVLGIILYFVAFYFLFKAFFKNKNVPVLIWILTITTWVFNAFFNMFYWYTCAALSYPFLLAAISFVQYSKKQNEISNKAEEEKEITLQKPVPKSVNNDNDYGNLHFANEE